MASLNSSKKPAYLVMAEIISQQIHSGVYRLGQRLPAEATLAERYNLSPMTVRRSIKHLVRNGLVRSIHGSGTYVARLNLKDSVFNLNLFQHLFVPGDDMVVELLETSITIADSVQAQKLETMQGISLVTLNRLIHKNGQPMAVYRTHLIYNPKVPSVEAELNMSTMNDLLEGGERATFKKGLMTFAAAILDEKDANTLKLQAGELIYALEVVFYDFDDRPVSYGRFTIPCHLITLSNKVGLWNE